jgi:hypothetical protein
MMALAGALVRWVFGLAEMPWVDAPDQLAWELLLDEARDGPLRFDQLVHYPHEGASALVGLLAWLLPSRVAGLPALSAAALIVDTGSRAVQIAVVHRVFGSTVGKWFGWWTVVTVPGLLPWGTAGFGLHGLAAFWPFVLMVLAARRVGVQPVPVGLVLGLAVAWALDSLVVLAAAVTFVFTSGRQGGRLRATALVVVAALAVLVPWWLLWTQLDVGFQLEKLGPLSVRGMSPSVVNLLWAPVRFLAVPIVVIPGATWLPTVGGPVGTYALRLVWTAACVMGTSLVVSRRAEPAATVGLLVLLWFFVAYAASPFYVASPLGGDYVAYRHLAFVLPLLVALAWRGVADTARWRRWFAVTLLGLGVLGALGQVGQPQGAPTVPPVRAAGWVLGRKLGHDVPRLSRLAARMPDDDRAELERGFGWGLTATVLGRGSTRGEEGLLELVELLNAFPAAVRPGLIRGVVDAFDPRATPRLEPALQAALLARLGSETDPVR